MDKFKEGGIVFHKATGSRCVVISKNDNGTIKVRTNSDLERDYYPQELKTEEEDKAETMQQLDSIPNKDWSI